MNPDYTLLATLLQARLDTIANTQLRDTNPELQLKQLQEVSESIQNWHKQNRSEIPAQLRHFLTQSSLSKALDYIHTENLTKA